MGRNARRSRLRTALSLALLAAFCPLAAQENQFEASVTAGVGALTGDSADRALFGQYNGLRTNDFVGLLGFDYTRIKPDSATVVSAQGSNLLLDTRELDLLWKQQGDWKIRLDYSELVWRDPRTLNTGLIGAGTTTPQVNPLTGGPGSGSDIELKIKRQALGLGFQKVFGPAWQFDVSLKTEKKEGARLFGIGFNCPSPYAPGCLGTTGSNVGWATLLVPEPIDALHSQVEARISYGGERLRLSGGYYGSFYRNSNETLNPLVPGSLNNAVGSLLPLSGGLQALLNRPIALSPDNEAHHFDLAGIYAFTGTTRLHFKLGYARAIQDQQFSTTAFAPPPGVASLDGEVVTTLAQVGISSRPLPALSLLAEIKYRDRDDRTPIALYNIEGVATYTNRHVPNTKVAAKGQVSYRFSPDYSGTLAATFESIDRGVLTSTAAIAGTSALRQDTDETGLSAELRRRMSENVSASLIASTSQRKGSNWLKDNSGLGVTEVTDAADPSVGFSTAIFSPTLADRRRNKVRAFATWQATDDLLMQFAAEGGRDSYTTPSAYGLRSTRMSLFSFDWDYALTSAWRMNGYLSYGEQTLHQARPAETILSFENRTASAGVGVTGRISNQINVGGELSYIHDRSIYDQTLDSTAPAAAAALLNAAGGLPDIQFRQARLTLFGRYELDKSSQLLLRLIYQRSKWNDWTWEYNGVRFAYSDGSTIFQDPDQQVGFIGVSYAYRWR